MNIKLILLVILTGFLTAVSTEAANYTVDRTDDATVSTCTAAVNDCTLRGAIAAATGTTAVADTIDFDATIFNTAQTITLGGTQLSITGSATNTLTINGPGANLLSISAGGGAFRLFNIGSGAVVQINGVTITQSTANAINNAGTLTLNNSVVSDNGTAAAGNSAIFNSSTTASLTLNNSTVTNNRIPGGTGVSINSTGGTVTINNSIISNNDGDSDNTGNAASGGGIAISGTASLTITGSILSGNISGNGGAIFINGNGNVSITDTTISNNIIRNTGGGGGIFMNNNCSSSTVTIERTTISGNTADSVGGGINKTGACTLNISNSTISGNTTLSAGGGIAHSTGALTLTNSTVSGNLVTSAIAPANGGGILNDVNGTVTLNSVTLSNNSVNNPAGIGGFANTAATSTATFNNTIIANSSNNLDCSNNGTLNASFSLIESNLNCVSGTNTNNLTGDPNLGPLANNGGTTQTHLPLFGAIIIDAGNSALTTDQRGSIRPIDLSTYPNAANGADIGAVELQAAPPTSANVSIGGRVLVDKGNGLRNAVVTLTDSNGVTRTARTGTFGYYRFDDIAAGQTVIVTVISKRFTFTPQVVNITDNLNELNFAAESSN